MRQLVLSLFTISLLLFAGCGKEGSPSLTTFTVTVNRTFIADASNAWVVMYNNAGKVLSYQSAITGDVLKFDVPSGTTPTILTILYYPFATDTAYVIESYSGITQQELALGRNDHKIVSLAGESIFNFTDVPNPTTLAYSARNNASGSAQYSTGDVISGHLTTFLGSESNKSIFVTATNFSKPYYKLINDTENALNFTTPYADLEEFDTYRTIDFPPSLSFNATVYGLESDQTRDEFGFTLFNNYAAGSRTKNASSVVLGYLNALADFNTTFFATYADYRLYYNAVGSVPPDKIVWPLPADFSVADNSVGNLTVTPGTTFLYRNTSWLSSFNTGGDNTVVYRDSHSPYVTERIDDIPAALLALHPKLSMRFAAYSNTAFTTAGSPYSDFIDYTLTGKYQTVQFEGVSIIVK